MSYKRRHSVKFVDDDLDVIKRKINDYDNQFGQFDSKIRRLEQSFTSESVEDRLRRLEKDHNLLQKFQTQLERCFLQMEDVDHELKRIIKEVEGRFDRQFLKFDERLVLQTKALGDIKQEMVSIRQQFQKATTIEIEEERPRLKQNYMSRLDVSDIRDVRAKASTKNSDDVNKTFDYSNYAPSQMIQEKKRLIDEEIERRLKEEENRRAMIVGEKRSPYHQHTTQKQRTTEISNRLSLERKMKQDKISYLTTNFNNF